MRFLTFLPLVLTLLLASCIEGEEELWLERDGSGRLEATYKMPPLVMRSFGGPEELVKTLKEASARDQHVNLTHVSHRSEKGQVILEFSGTFDDLHKLCTFPQRQLRDPDEPDKPTKAEALFGETDFDISIRGISYHRTIDISSVLPKLISSAPHRLKDSSFHYILNLPMPASETNAPTLSSAEHKLEWTFLLRDYVNEPMILSAECPLPLPRKLWLLGLLPIAVLVAIFLFRTKRSLHQLESAAASR